MHKMKKFETPVIEVVKFEVSDVVTTSSTTGGAGGVYEGELD